MTENAINHIIRLIDTYDKLHESTEECEKALDAKMYNDEDYTDEEATWDICYKFEIAALMDASRAICLLTRRKVDIPTARQMITDHREKLMEILNNA